MKLEQMVKQLLVGTALVGVVYQFVNDSGALRGVFTATGTGANAYLAAVI